MKAAAVLLVLVAILGSSAALVRPAVEESQPNTRAALQLLSQLGQEQLAAIARAGPREEGSLAAAGGEYVEGSSALPCRNGPRKVLRKDTINGQQFMYYSFKAQGLLHSSSCSGLNCSQQQQQQGGCLSRRNLTQTDKVLKIRILPQPPYFQIVGLQVLQWVDHLECSCYSCQDIPSFAQCRCEEGCPNVNASEEGLRGSFCRWAETKPREIPASMAAYAPGQCSCCRVPKFCPKGRYFSRASCSCQCVEFPCRKGQVFNRDICLCVDILFGGVALGN